MKTVLRAAAAGLVIFSLFALTSAVAAQTFKGKLDAANTKQTHSVKLEQGKTYKITMTSPQFDTFLYLQDADGKEIVKNDDISFALKNLNSRIVYTPAKGGDYKLVASSFQETGTGEYTIEIETINKVGDAKIQKGKLDNDSPLLLGKIRHQTLKVKLEQGKSYVIDAVSEKFDALVAVREVGDEMALAVDDGSGGEGKSARVYFVPPKTETFEVLVAARPGTDLGDFTMTIQEYAAKKKADD